MLENGREVVKFANRNTSNPARHSRRPCKATVDVCGEERRGGSVPRLSLSRLAHFFSVLSTWGHMCLAMKEACGCPRLTNLSFVSIVRYSEQNLISCEWSQLNSKFHMRVEKRVQDHFGGISTCLPLVSFVVISSENVALR